MKVRAMVFLSLLAGAIAVVGFKAPAAGAQETFEIRLATLAPRGSTWMRAFQRWDRELRSQTGDRLRLRIYPGGAAGDERTVVRKMRANQLDAAAVTTTGLGVIVRPVLVLQAPGVIDSYAQLDAVRSELAPEFEQQFEQAGFKLLGWGDAGQTRLFSKRPINRPADMRAGRPWAWRDNPIAGAFIRAAGANPVELGVPEVYPALQTGMIDTVPASALAAVALQWFTRLDYVSAQASGVVVGAMIMRKEKFDAMPAELQRVITATSSANNSRVQRAIREADQRAYTALLQRGLRPMDMQRYRGEWEAVARRAREQLTGRLFPADLLRRVEAIAARAATAPAAAQ